jgi:superfamily II DNA or RNA helicase
MLHTELRDYQRRAAQAALSFDGFAIFCEQRTGKTLIAISVIAHRKPKELLIVCPKAAIREWDEQLDRHLAVRWPCHVQIMNYEEVVKNRKKLERWASKVKKDLMIVCDESHRLKNPHSKQSRALRSLGRRAKYRLALTGTPISQGYQDAWAQFDFIDRTVFGRWSSRRDEETDELLEEGFKDRYLRYGGFKNKKVVGYNREEEFLEKFHSRSYRVTLREARTKPLRIRRVKVPVLLEPRTRKLYRTLEKTLRVEANRVKIRVKSMMNAVMKLQQLSGGFLIQNDWGLPRTVEQVSSEKLNALGELILGELSQSKLVVVCRFIHEVEAVEARLQGYFLSTKRVMGGEPFDGKFHCDAIVMQIQSGIAVDMSEADAIVFYSTDYSYLNYEQARFRILSYDKPQATYYYLLAQDTVDLQIYEAVTRKKKIADVVCDHYRYRKRGAR